MEPKSVSLNNKVYKTAEEVLNSYGIYWIGVTDRRSEGRYSYNSDVSDANVDLGAWFRGEPNSNTENCVVLQTSPGKWWDTSCSNKRPSICEMA